MIHIKYKQVFRETYNFFEKYLQAQEGLETEEQWEEYWYDLLGSEASIVLSHNDDKFLIGLLVACVDELECQYKLKHLTGSN